MKTFIIRADALVTEEREYASAAFNALLTAFGVNELKIESDEAQPDKDGSKNFSVAGSAHILSESVPIKLYLDFLSEDKFEFQLTAAFPTLTLSVLRDHGILPGSSFVTKLLPKSFPDVKVIFDSERTRLYFAAIESNERIDIFGNLLLDKLGFEFLRSYTENSILLDIYATISIGDTSIETKIEIPLAGSLSPKSWVLSSRSSIPFASGLTEIIHFLGSVFNTPFDDVFPKALNSIPVFFLDDLKILLDPDNGSIEFLTFRVKSVGALNLAEQVSIKKVGLRVNVTPARGRPGVSLTLFGSIQVKEDVWLDLQVMLPENLSQDSWVFFVSGGVELHGMADISLLPVNTPANDLHLHPGFLKVDSLDLKIFEVDFNPITSTVSKILFRLQINAECELINELKLENPSLSFTAVNPFNNAKLGKRSLTGSASGTIAVGDINFGISAEKLERGWRFTGTTETREIHIGRMISALGKKFGAQMPDFLNGVDLENLTLRFETSADEQENKSTRVTFDCQGHFPVHDKTARLSLAADVTRNQSSADHKPSYTIDLSGELKISTLHFKTTYSKNAADNFFTATYTHTTEQRAINLKEVIDSISTTAGSLIPETLEVDLKYVMLAYEKNTAGSNFLFGMDLGVSANLADLVSNLPLVGKMLPPGQTIGIDDIQILVTLKPFDQTIGGKLAGLLPDESANQAGKKMVQNGLASGINISAAIRFGDTKRPMNLPVSAASDSAPVASPGETASDNAKWFALQKAFGPVYFNRVGVQYKDGELYVLLDAALSAAGLTLSLDGLSVSSPLNQFHPTFHLRGLGIDYKREDSFEIAGAFLRGEREINGKKYEEYAGAALLKIKQLALSAIGAYSYYEDHPSLFIYCVLDYPIGGPSFFFVTGLAFGFGYNRRLVMPAFDQVAQFPLVARAVNGPSKTEKLDRSALDTTLQNLAPSVPPSVGDTFLAIGIKFKSFKIVDSFALLAISFGNHFELNLLGYSSLIAPASAGPNVPPVAEAQLMLKASFLPDKGFLCVQAQLTPNSYILSKACHLTGGFAFYSWFAGSEHDGDFVLTLGGYHPHFLVPAHYPTVPRLGFNWQVSNELSLKGDAYFALTASALMAGGHLEANWRSGSVHAWFKVGADFLIAWKPYHYEINAYVDLGADVTFEFFGTQHITIDVGADLHIWGPEFTGEATIHLWIISFQVAFGATASQKPRPIDWTEFKESFLHEKPEKEKEYDVCSIAVTGGLIGKDQEAKGDDLGVIDPKHFSLAVNTVIPLKEAWYECESFCGKIELGTRPLGQFGIAPMEVKAADLISRQIITIQHNDAPLRENTFEYSPIYKKVPVGRNADARAEWKTFRRRRSVRFRNPPQGPAKTGGRGHRAKQITRRRQRHVRIPVGTVQDLLRGALRRRTEAKERTAKESRDR
jgi:hypothetical protein